MIVDREKEIEAFVPEKYWQLGLDTEKSGELIEARHTHGRFHDKAEAEGARDRTKEPLVVTDVKEGTKQDRAPSPFDTTTYIVAAARLGILGSKRDADRRRPVHERFHLLPEDRQYRVPGIARHQRDSCRPCVHPRSERTWNGSSRTAARFRPGGKN